MAAYSVTASPQFSCLEAAHEGKIPSQKLTREEAEVKIDKHFKKASETPILGEKRKAYNKAFSTLKNYFCPELRPRLFCLLEKYAKKTCYGQESEELDTTGRSVDDELGFRICARLMELSFCMQMRDLGLLDFDYNWSQHTSLETLTKDLQVEPGQKGPFFDAIDQTSCDGDVLMSKAYEAGLQEIMAKTLCSLAFSYQNIGQLNDTGHYGLHKKLQDWTEAVIGNETPRQKERLVEFRYNRCLFMLLLEHPDASLEEKVAIYEPIKELLFTTYPTGHDLLLQKEAQINNMQGLIITRSGQTDALVKAEPYFLAAYELYKKIPRNKFLIGNVLTSLIACETTKPLDPESAAKLKICVKELREIIGEFQEEDNQDSYATEYPLSVQQADEALERYEPHQP
jgi:hypothetical protein